jgi:Zn-dependent peptidase ImmA (M78 family)/DNA-binding XRE family transcriptional regulator
MIILAREARGMSQQALADKLGISRANMSKLEAGEVGFTSDYAKAIGKYTKFPVSFFMQTEEVLPEHLIYRKREKLANSIASPINAKMNIVRFNIQTIIYGLNVKHVDLRIFQVTEDNTPQKIAQALRKEWKIKDVVIPDMIQLLEGRGIPVMAFPFNTDRIDCRTVITKTMFPVFVYNNQLLGDKLRFSLARHLGHLVMHSFNRIGWDTDITHEANQFAAEFLVPEKEVRKDFDKGVTIASLADLKLKWKVAMISLLFRADDLGYLSANQKKYLLSQFNEMMIRKREPIELDVAISEPKLIRQWIEKYKQKVKFEDSQMAGLLRIKPEDYYEWYGAGQEAEGIKKEKV